MASIASGLILGGLSALGGLFGGNKSTQDSTTTSTPNFSPSQLALINQVLSQYGSLIKNTPVFNKAYELGGVQNFLKNSINANDAASSILSARGINRTTAGAKAIADTGYQEGSNIASFLANAPIAEQQNTTDLLGKAGGFTTAIPTGSTSTSHTTGTGNAPLSPVAGFLSGGAQGLAATLGQQTAIKNLANVLKNIPVNNAAISTPSNTFSYGTPDNNFGDTDTGLW